MKALKSSNMLKIIFYDMYYGIIYSMNEKEYGYILTTISRWKKDM